MISANELRNFDRLLRLIKKDSKQIQNDLEWINLRKEYLEKQNKTDSFEETAKEIGFHILVKLSQEVHKTEVFEFIQNDLKSHDWQVELVQNIKNCEEKDLINYFIQMINLCIHHKVLTKESFLLKHLWGINTNQVEILCALERILKTIGLNITQNAELFFKDLNSNKILTKLYKQLLILAFNCQKVDLFNHLDKNQKSLKILILLITIFYFLDGSKQEIDEKICELKVQIFNDLTVKAKEHSIFSEVYRLLVSNSQQALWNFFEFNMHCLDFRIENRNSFLLIEDMEPTVLTKDDEFSKQQSKTDYKNGKLSFFSIGHKLIGSCKVLPKRLADHPDFFH